MFRAEQVTLHRHGKNLLDQVSLTITPGEMTAIIGPNGAGKSTLLKTFAAEIKPDTGQIVMNGKPLSQWSAREQAKVRAILPQSSQLTFPFKVPDVVMMGRSPYQGQMTNAENGVIVDQVMQMTEVSHLRERTFTTLSGGERQRVQLARVLAQLWVEEPEQPRYLLLDEPTSALDLPHQHHVLSIAGQLAKNHNMGVLVVLHDLNLAAMYADRIAILKSGRRVCEGTPQDVLNAHHIHDSFGINVAVSNHPDHDCPLIISHRSETNTGHFSCKLQNIAI